MAIHQNCHVIGVAGGKGGVGKSVFAANLACALLQEMRAKVLLIDLDAKSAGDQNIITGIRPTHTVSDLTNFSGSISERSLPSIVDVHPSGLHFIGAVSGPEQTLYAQPELFKKQLGLISPFYQYIIIDLGNDMGKLQVAAVEDASSVMIVTSPEVLVVNQTRRILNEFMSATFPAEMFHIVVNKVSKSGLNPQSIAQNLRRPIIGTIPQDDVITMGALQRSTPFVISHRNSPVSSAYSTILRNLTGGILQKLKVLQRPTGANLTRANPQGGGQTESSSQTPIDSKNSDPLSLLKTQVHRALIEEMDLKEDLTSSRGNPQKEAELRQKTKLVITQLTDRLGQGLSREDRSHVIKSVLDEALGLGALEDLLADPSVTEIMVNRADRVFAEINGKIQLTPLTFSSNDQLKLIIERIVAPLGRQINEKVPYVDARLQDGSRVNAVIGPLAIDGPAITIRKFSKDQITADNYLKWGTCNKNMVDFLRLCVEQGLNIIVSGGTGSGKTTLLNVLSSFIPSNERVITVEDAAELQLRQEHVVRLETRPATTEGGNEITIRDLIRNSLRMRPDRIIVGECRDGAALDMLSAMNTGHDGSMTTVHANNPKEAISRVETLVMMAGMDLPTKAIREQVAGAVHLIVQISRMSDGSRKIKSITEVGVFRGDVIELQEIFYFKETGFDKNRRIIGEYKWKGLMPSFIEQFERRGIAVPKTMFNGANDDDSGSNGSNEGGGSSGGQPQRTRPPQRRAPVPTRSPNTAVNKKASGDNE